MKFLRIIKLYHVVDQCDSGSDLEELIKWELICFYWNNKNWGLQRWILKRMGCY